MKRLKKKKKCCGNCKNVFADMLNELQSLIIYESKTDEVSMLVELKSKNTIEPSYKTEYKANTKIII